MSIPKTEPVRCFAWSDDQEHWGCDMWEELDDMLDSYYTEEDLRATFIPGHQFSLFVGFAQPPMPGKYVNDFSEILMDRVYDEHGDHSESWRDDVHPVLKDLDKEVEELVNRFFYQRGMMPKFGMIEEQYEVVLKVMEGFDPTNPDYSLFEVVSGAEYLK